MGMGFRPFHFLCRRSAAKVALSLAALILGGFILLVLLVGASSNVETEFAAPLPDAIKAKLFVKRAQEYCNNPARSRVRGAEGSLPFNGSHHYRLVQVHMVARHGDRSPSFDSWLNEDLQVSCGLPQAERHWEKLQDFTMQRLAASGITPGEDINLFPGYKERLCQVGELTPNGYMQHYQLGLFLKKQYDRFISHAIKSDKNWNDNIFVHSTYFPRTLGSAASFLLGFLADKPSIRKSVPINYSHGTQLYGVPQGTKMAYRWCPYLRDIIKGKHSELEGGRMFYRNDMNKFARLLKKPASKLPKPTIIVDNLLVRSCHRNKLPCGEGGCVRLALAYRLLEYAEWTMEHTHTSTYSILAMQPFVINSLLSKIMAVVNSLPQEKNYETFLLYFAHDTTLTPLMTLLGIPPKKWVPYASRLVIELWKQKESSDPAELVGLGPYYIRILFNGQNWTSKLPLPPGTFALAKGLVKLRAWRNFLTTGRFREKESYDKECGNI